MGPMAGGDLVSLIMSYYDYDFFYTGLYILCNY